jgi:hypothetical protein
VIDYVSDECDILTFTKMKMFHNKLIPEYLAVVTPTLVKAKFKYVSQFTLKSSILLWCAVNYSERAETLNKIVVLT